MRKFIMLRWSTYTYSTPRCVDVCVCDCGLPHAAAAGAAVAFIRLSCRQAIQNPRVASFFGFSCFGS